MVWPKAIPLSGVHFTLFLQVHRKKLPQYLLPVKEGDTLSYVLAEAIGEPSAISAKLISFSQRNQNALATFFDNTVQCLNYSISSQV